MQHFEISLDGKNEYKIVSFGDFEIFLRRHGNKKFKIVHTGTKTFVL
jgi:hypothetical protein